jgi:predicted 3-demethylubiquinone-9 3-methyltransferase (glyoxalase superfamily)
MQQVKACLLLNENTEEAVNFYVSLFDNSAIKRIQRYGPGMPVPEGQVLSIDFTISGQEFLALNGPKTHFTDAISFMISCEMQEEIDRYYDGLAANGGEEIACGWVKDRFGIVWQIIWGSMSKLLFGGDREATGRTFQAMMAMKKIDIEALKKAFNG